MGHLTGACHVTRRKWVLKGNTTMETSSQPADTGSTQGNAPDSQAPDSHNEVRQERDRKHIDHTREKDQPTADEAGRKKVEKKEIVYPFKCFR